MNANDVPAYVFTEPRNYLQFHRNIFLTRGGVLLFKRSWMPEPSGWGSPAFIVRLSGLIACKMEGFILKRNAHNPSGTRGSEN